MNIWPDGEGLTAELTKGGVQIVPQRILNGFWGRKLWSDFFPKKRTVLKRGVKEWGRGRAGRPAPETGSRLERAVPCLVSLFVGATLIEVQGLGKGPQCARIFVLVHTRERVPEGGDSRGPRKIDQRGWRRSWTCLAPNRNQNAVPPSRKKGFNRMAMGS